MATNPKAASTAGTKKTVKALRVVARTPGFRRAGRAFGVEPTDIPLSDLSEKQIEALRKERELVVMDVDIDAEEAPAEEAK